MEFQNVYIYKKRLKDPVAQTRAEDYGRFPTLSILQSSNLLTWIILEL